MDLSKDFIRPTRWLNTCMLPCVPIKRNIETPVAETRGFLVSYSRPRDQRPLGLATGCHSLKLASQTQLGLCLAASPRYSASSGANRELSYDSPFHLAVNGGVATVASEGFAVRRPIAWIWRRLERMLSRSAQNLDRSFAISHVDHARNPGYAGAGTYPASWFSYKGTTYLASGYNPVHQQFLHLFLRPRWLEALNR